MIKKFRKKPVEIQAEQFVIWDYKNVPNLVEIMGRCFEVKGVLYDRYIEIPTLEGVMKAKPHDYIIKGVNGELYPCKEDIFKNTYDEV